MNAVRCPVCEKLYLSAPFYVKHMCQIHPQYMVDTEDVPFDLQPVLLSPSRIEGLT